MRNSAAANAACRCAAAVTTRTISSPGVSRPKRWRTVTPWSGRVKVDRGEVVGVEGARFRRGDRARGPDSWEASSLKIRKAANKKRRPHKPKEKELGAHTSVHKVLEAERKKRQQAGKGAIQE